MDTSSSVADRQPQHPRVRRATGEDLPDAARVQSECLAEIGAGSIDADVLAALTSEDAVESTVEQWRQLYDEGAQFWVLDDDGAIVGVAMTRRMPPAEAPTTLELATIHVMPRARLRGVADELLSSAIGQEPAFVWVLNTSEHAIGFFEKNGFSLDHTAGSLDNTLGGIPLQRMVRGHLTSSGPVRG
ncbi:GNAT family N-acetyltransferase [Cutibacterium granulosum]|jgi:hypothetical protein|uniref:GNAT family N-acetyltransferase n=1 Tax=Cutibacterium granulosum TaxID=33011 RepID=UPI000DB29A06|nr:GNAT family N-acetyltransferase [Cutibacterium granulosum]MDU3272466.1 GNAT family N-acetyltransferase [Cutibacterium sp.]MDU7727709.1 GNAT family N-acetyltransferase [Cutibacterium granulosum]MEA5633909.1 GNAT family N-acetyltransferase [Cutibacterium granulosum]MEA5637568.1 GNAT family N-acetyltransferase [Cutibacterium granulosum]MEA5639121.1 GNAT family N-acetyltransferase [Cutibacterium granulosum]